MINRISCVECHQCNRKGHPSVMRGSKYCDEHYTKQVRVSFFSGLFTRFIDRVRDRIFEKRFDEKTGGLKSTKGFRKDWFTRMGK